jgi:hypothetical protein
MAVEPKSVSKIATISRAEGGQLQALVSPRLRFCVVLERNPIDKCFTASDTGAYLCRTLTAIMFG